MLTYGLNVEKVRKNMFDGMFGKIAHGMCRLSMSGGIAVKTTSGYKSYNVKTGNLVNCNNFAMDIGDDFFFVIPTAKVDVGDIILVNGKPKCVIEVDKKTLKVMNYEDSTIDTIVPERHVFMGNAYFYGKIVSMFGTNVGKGKDGMKQMMQFMMLSKMFGNGTGTGMNTNGNNMLPMMLMMGGDNNLFGNMLDGAFDFDCADDVDESEAE